MLDYGGSAGAVVQQSVQYGSPGPYISLELEGEKHKTEMPDSGQLMGLST